jgi:hypothetical protein
VPQHPDHEQLAAFQAGDGDRRQRSEVEAHLAGCPACAELVASLAQARRRLALLEEPELPPGLHDRLAAAVAAEAAAGEPVQRPTPWYRRPVAWGAAAALLLAALVAPLLDQSGGVRTTADDAGGGAQELAQAPQDTAGLPLIRVPGEVSAASVRSRLASDARARQALASAAGTRGSAASGGQGTAAAPKAEGDTLRGDAPPSTAASAAPTSTLAGGASSPTRAPALQPGGAPAPGQPAAPGGAAGLQACLPAATAAADPGTTPLAPAFFIEGTYRGRPATVLVTTSTSQPTRVDLWVFPRGTCTAPPLATERVR